MGESQVMAAMLEQHQTPEAAAADWLQRHPQVRAAWLEGVLTRDARSPLAARAIARSDSWALERWITGHKVPVGDAMAGLVAYVKTHGNRGVRRNFDARARRRQRLELRVAGDSVAALDHRHQRIDLVLRRSVAAAAFVALALLFIMNQGYLVRNPGDSGARAGRGAYRALIGVRLE